MRNWMRFLTLFLVLVFSFVSNAQTINITCVSLKPDDDTAIKEFELDLNGDTCALVKIIGNGLDDLIFPNNNQYKSTSYQGGIHLVYVPSGRRKLDFRYPDYLPGQIDFSQFGFRMLKGGKTYEVILEKEGNRNQSMVILMVSPPTATIFFDQQRYDNATKGLVQIPVEKGTHHYKVSADGYAPKEQNVDVNYGETITLSISLEEIKHPVRIITNATGARVYVDNVYYGTADKTLYVGKGIHTFRLQANDFKDGEKTITINSSNNVLNIDLLSNKKTEVIKQQEVIIDWIPSNSDIYVNNRRVDSYYHKQGHLIYLMPGRYLISDENGDNKRKIDVVAKDN